MQIELSVDDIKSILVWADESKAYAGRDHWDEDLVLRIEQALEQAEELESIDLNDCADGACTL